MFGEEEIKNEGVFTTKNKKPAFNATDKLVVKKFTLIKRLYKPKMKKIKVDNKGVLTISFSKAMVYPLSWVYKFLGDIKKLKN